MLIDRAGFTNFKTLSDEPTAKQISDFQREIHDVVIKCNGGWQVYEESEPYIKRSSVKKRFDDNIQRSIESRKKREIKKKGLVDFVQLETGVNNGLEILTKHFNKFLNGGGRFYDRKTDRQIKEGNPLLNINSYVLKDFVTVFLKILKSKMIKVSDIDISAYGDKFEKNIKKSNFLIDIEDDV